MKIQCDVCNKNEASVFCTADEAALCQACDHRVHHVNKLASKHERFSLLQPSTNQFPLCDICQERRAILFCQQDRAILCRECDIPIHKANEHTQKHNRYLFTGIKLSANSALHSSTPSAATSASSFKSQNPTNKPAAVEAVTVVKEKVGGFNSQLVNVGGNNLTSSISEYLEMLPGWHVEDFLDSSTPNGSSKVKVRDLTFTYLSGDLIVKKILYTIDIGDEDILSFWDTNLESHMSSFPPQNIGVWVPQAPPPMQSKQQAQTQFLSPSNLNFGGQVGIKDSREVNSIKSSKKWRDDNSFAVPQISPPSTSFKRSRTLW